ncbi:hypothetical protein BU26DRAFT_523378 [Trematosphaeria pertusa]|uniref:Uncharacterized protein n=1 Tax=Trematosphaeria pertusa TaxID=390896 RepID=A0A6A6HZY2_9PLEO|nr:uncharacterized protein BU26DRAFT_523378 [Trematosphaeria pertusa]KAF2243794.1 hypothetical protein BU26DRAFT_523378 [Trematosphaeria pertusa]
MSASDESRVRLPVTENACFFLAFGISLSPRWIVFAFKVPSPFWPSVTALVTPYHTEMDNILAELSQLANP